MDEQTNSIELAVTLATAWLGNPNTRCTPEEVHAFVRDSHATLLALSQPQAAGGAGEPAEEAREFVPAVSVRKSTADPEFILSMIDGKPYRALRRHLTTHGLTPETYRERYGLKSDYPMVAPAYAAKRSQLAKDLGLGRKGAAARAERSPDGDASADAPAGKRGNAKGRGARGANADAA